MVGAELHVCDSKVVVGLLIQGKRCLSGYMQPRQSLKGANSVLPSLLSPQLPQPRWDEFRPSLGLNKLFTFAVSAKVWLCSEIILTFSCFEAVGFPLSPHQLKVYSWSVQVCPNFRASSRKGSSSCSSQPARKTPLAGLRQACYDKFIPTRNSGKRENLHEVHISSTLAHVASNSAVPSKLLESQWKDLSALDTQSIWESREGSQVFSSHKYHGASVFYNVFWKDWRI